MDRNEVTAAFEIVLEEIETVVDGLNQDGAGAFQKGDYDTARSLIETATSLAEFRDKVRNLQKQWDSIFSARIPKKRGEERRFPQLQRGLRTTEDAFRRPILETLVEMGGAGQVKNVLDRVGEKMKTLLSEYDHQPLPLSPNTVRWRNTAQWCRKRMVKEGLLRADSPRGIWEISDKGKEALKSQQV